ncbi:MAG: ATP-binding protein [DPANN group archaeon]|nr:ATP-binding protein [DPANN group archaeon]
MDDKHLIAKRKEFNESETLELKTSTSELKEAVIPIVAMLNKHQSRTLYFGIKDNGVVIGQDVGVKTLRDVSKTIADHVKPTIFHEITHEIVDNKDCIKVGVNGTNIPYYAYGRAYCA